MQYPIFKNILDDKMERRREIAKKNKKKLT